VDCFEKKILDNSAHFIDTDKRHIRVFQKRGERNLKGGWRGNGTVLVGWEEKETWRERSFSIHSPNEFLLSRTDDYEIPREASVMCGGRTTVVAFQASLDLLNRQICQKSEQVG
jgi:hypothetical protein